MPYGNRLPQPPVLAVGSPEWERRCVEVEGWFMHDVLHRYPEGLANYHTHGLEDSLGHPDLQIVMRVGGRVAAETFQRCVEIIRGWGRGPKFTPGEDYSAVIRDYPVRFAEATECGRRVLRLILPDADGRVALGEISEPWDAQWRHLNL